MKKKVLITGPSLDQSDNVSGISSVVSNIIAHDDYVFYHFILGKTDKTARNWAWLFKQFLIPFQFCFYQLVFRPEITHINMPLNILAMIRDGLLIIIAFFFNTKTIIHLHGGHYLKKSPPGWGLHKFISSTFSLSSRIIVLSEIEKNWFINEFNIPNKKITVIENAVEIPEITLTRTLQKPITFLFIGRIVESKGIYFLAEAFENLKLNKKYKFKLLLAGSGPESDNLVPRLKNTLGDSFSYLGVVRNDQKDSAYLTSDFFILPSTNGEGLPMALLEAMSFGLVPLTTDDGAMGELVNDKTGFLIKKNSVTSLVSVLKKAIKSFEVGNYFDLAQNSRSLITQQYDVKSYLKKIGNAYDFK
jgi:glycosyltransferase involved in cell wall biosynthesis